MIKDRDGNCSVCHERVTEECLCTWDKKPFMEDSMHRDLRNQITKLEAELATLRAEARIVAKRLKGQYTEREWLKDSNTDGVKAANRILEGQHD